MDYNQLIGPKTTPGSVAMWLNNSTIQNDVPEIILEAESWVYRRLRHWRMLTPPVAGFFTVGSDFIANPADMLEPSYLKITGTNFAALIQRTMEDVIDSWMFDGSGNRVPQQPRIYYFDQGALRFDSPADQAYPYVLVYYQQLSPLSVSLSNFLTTIYPRLMRCAIMAAACEWAKDSGVGSYDRTYWDTLAQDEVVKAQAESDRATRAIVAPAIFL